MRNLSILILVVAIIFSLSSCAIHSGLTGNLNNSTTNVVLQTNNYKIIQKVKGEASGMSVLGIFGGSFRPLVEQARSRMLESANLIGKPRAIINETVEVNNKFFVVVGFKTVTVSAYVIEFTDTGFLKGDEAINSTPTTTDKPTKSTEPINNNGETKVVIDDITGKWISKNGDFEITIDGNVGVFSQINSGKWLNLLKKGKVSIGYSKFKEITKTGKMTWKCKDYDRDISFFGHTSNLTLDNTGNILTVSNQWDTYTLTKVNK